MFEDKTLKCVECGNEFVFSASEQEFYAEKGFTNVLRKIARFIALTASINVKQDMITNKFL